jgi:hypothetical protein
MCERIIHGGISSNDFILSTCLTAPHVCSLRLCAGLSGAFACAQGAHAFVMGASVGDELRAIDDSSLKSKNNTSQYIHIKTD